MVLSKRICYVVAHFHMTYARYNSAVRTLISLISCDREKVSALQKQVTQNQAEALETSTAALRREEDLKVRWAHEVSRL